MADSPGIPADSLAELRERIHALEARVDCLEHGRAIPGRSTSASSQRPRSEDSEEVTAARAFTRIAMLSFTLFGALILRILTQQNVLGTGFGTVLGVIYAGHLIVLSFLPGRLGNLARQTSLFQCSGVVLGFVIAIESSMRTHTMDRPTAMVLIAGFAALAALVGVLRNKVTLVATGLLGAVAAIIALSLDRDHLALQLVLLVGLTATAVGFSWKDRWGHLRLLALPLLMLILSIGMWLAHQQSMSTGPLVLAAGALWAIVVIQHVAALHRLGPAAAWLPGVTIWVLCLAAIHGWNGTGKAAAVVATLALALLPLIATRGALLAPATAGLTATATVAGLVGWPSLDTSGLLCALAGTALWLTASRAPTAWSAGGAILLMGEGAALHLYRLLSGPAPRTILAAGLLLAALLILHYLRSGRIKPTESGTTAQLLAPVALAAGLLVLLALFREVARRLIMDESLFLLAQTAVLSGTAVGLTAWGHVSHRRAVFYSGVVCMVLALAKVGLVDLLQLKSLYLLASVIFIGLSSVAVSLILRRRGPSSAP